MIKSPSETDILQKLISRIKTEQIFGMVPVNTLSEVLDELFHIKQVSELRCELFKELWLCTSGVDRQRIILREKVAFYTAGQYSRFTTLLHECVLHSILITLDNELCDRKRICEILRYLKENNHINDTRKTIIRRLCELIGKNTFDLFLSQEEKIFQKAGLEKEFNALAGEIKLNNVLGQVIHCMKRGRISRSNSQSLLSEIKEVESNTHLSGLLSREISDLCQYTESQPDMREDSIVFKYNKKPPGKSRQYKRAKSADDRERIKSIEDISSESTAEFQNNNSPNIPRLDVKIRTILENNPSNPKFICEVNASGVDDTPSFTAYTRMRKLKTVVPNKSKF